MKSLSLAPRSYGFFFATPRSMLAQASSAPPCCSLRSATLRASYPNPSAHALAGGSRRSALRLEGRSSGRSRFSWQVLPFPVFPSASPHRHDGGAFTYGAMTGLKEKGRLNPHVAVLIALLTGRVAF